MIIRKFDEGFSRRMFLERTAAGVAAAGVLTPLWPQIARGDTSKVWPDELTSVEMYTKGKVKTGDVVTADNVDYVKDLLDPITYKQVKTMGRKINIVATVKDPSELYPMPFLEASLRNKGKAKLDANGNIVNGADGKAWIGGIPFAEPASGEQAIANLTLSWGRHDYCQYAITQVDLSPEGEQAYAYDFVWSELQANARLDGTSFHDSQDLLRLQSVWFTSPQDVSGTAFLSTWYYDQRKYPDLDGYLPAFRRVRQFPTNQRFEPLLPGITWFLSDAWAAGDPMLTWGNYKVIGRQPMLGAVSQNFHGSKPNWDAGVHGGGKGQTFFDTNFSMCPECIVLEAEPVGYPRAPVGKKRVWIDVRNHQFVAYITYDRRGEIWKSFEAGWSRYEDGATVVKDASGHPDWSWTYVMSHDIQSNRMSRVQHAESCAGGFKSQLTDNGVDVYNKYLTRSAIARLGHS
jgi:hypothetical protein